MLFDCLYFLGVDLDPIIRGKAIAFIFIGRSAFSRANSCALIGILLPGGLSDNDVRIVHLNVVHRLIELLLLALSVLRLGSAGVSVLRLDEFTLKLWSIALDIGLTRLGLILLSILRVHLGMNLCVCARGEDALAWVLLQLGVLLCFDEGLWRSNVQVAL